ALPRKRPVHARSKVPDRGAQLRGTGARCAETGAVAGAIHHQARSPRSTGAGGPRQGRSVVARRGVARVLLSSGAGAAPCVPTAVGRPAPPRVRPRRSATRSPRQRIGRHATTTVRPEPCPPVAKAEPRRARTANGR